MYYKDKDEAKDKAKDKDKDEAATLPGGSGGSRNNWALSNQSSSMGPSHGHGHGHGHAHSRSSSSHPVHHLHSRKPLDDDAHLFSVLQWWGRVSS